MNWVFISIISCTLLQMIFCRGLKFAFLSLLVMLIARVLFLLRSQGIVFKTKPLWITEAFVVGAQLVLGSISSSSYNWLVFLLYAVLTGVVVGVEFIDDKFYIYTVEDDKEDNK